MRTFIIWLWFSNSILQEANAQGGLLGCVFPTGLMANDVHSSLSPIRRCQIFLTARFLGEGPKLQMLVSARDE
jgi:hypothetical protein